MKNRFGQLRIGAILCILSLLVLYAVPLAYASNKEFTDLPADHPDYPYVKFLVEKHIVNGFDDGSFRPDKSISRAEMVTLLVKANQLNNETKSSQVSYKDVGGNHWAYKYIEAANNAGLVKGYGDGSFKPEAAVNRAEVCAFILRLTSESLPEVAVPSLIKDVPSGFWAERQIAVAIDSGMMNPLNENGFIPGKEASRLEVCRALATLLNISPDKSKTALTGTVVPLKGEVYVAETKAQAVKISATAPCGLGSTIKTSGNSEAEIRFPDGSGLKLDANTEIQIIASDGLSNFSHDGKPVSLVDYLEVKIIKGRIFGVLASTYQNKEPNPVNTSGISSRVSDSYLTASLDLPVDFQLAAAAASNTQQTAPWYKEQYAKKVRVQVDMPYGVASVRGTIWMNDVNESRQLTSVADGEVSVSSGGQSAAVPAGMSVEQNTLQGPPAAPQAMSVEQKQIWAGVNSWINERANAIEQAIPVIRGKIVNENAAGNAVAKGIINSVEKSTGNTITQSPSGSGGSSGGGGDTPSVLSQANATYGPAQGTQTLNSANISAPGITLRNTIVQGDLLLAEGIGEGNLTLDNVTVNGSTTIRGGGPNSIIVKNSTLGSTTINKMNGSIRILATGNTALGTLSMSSGCILAEENLTGPGFSNVVANTAIPSSALIVLSGAFNQVSVEAHSISINVLSGNISEFNVGSQSGGINVVLASGVNVANVILNAATNISGLGQIQTAYLNASNIIIEQIPSNLTTVANGIIGTVGGQQLSAGVYTLLQILQKLQALLSAGLDSQTEIDAAQQAYTEASNELNNMTDSVEKSELLAALQAYMTAINEAQAALKSTWVLTKSYDQALTSDFGVSLSSLRNYSYYAIYTSGEVQIDTRKLVSQKIRGLSIVFDTLSDLQLRFYNSTDAAEAAVATATLTGSCSNGEGLGVINF